MMVLVPALLALVFGWFAFRSRVTGVYFSIITQALTYALMLAFFRNDMGFGGNNGFTDFKDILGFDLHSDRTRVVLLVVTAAALAASYLACRAIVESRAGRVMRAIRDAESRTRFLGYPVESFKLWVFVFSAVIAGIAGALYVPQIGIINPSEFAPINSIEAVIWVAVGGRGTLYGAIAGAVLVNYAKTYLTGAFPEVWLYALGALVRAGDAVSAARDHRPGADGASGTRRQMSVRDKRLYLENLTVSFDGFKALNELTLYVDPGELLCIIGPNGAGKTTMMDVITGKTRPDSGTAWFGDGIDLLKLSEPEIVAGRNRAEVSETDRVRAVDGVRESRTGAGRQPVIPENAARPHYGRAARENRRSSRHHRPLRSSAKRREEFLSHGQKQWLEIGMLLMQNPELLLVDEPVAGMTPQEIERTAELLLSLAGEHSVVVVEHDMAFVRSIARRVTVLHEGQRHRGRRYGQSAERPARHRSLSGSVSVLAVKALNQFYGGSHTLWDVDLTVPAGSRMCLMGRNGMGKTTLLKCIMGLQPASSGSITFDGSDLLKCPAEQRARLGIGYVPQGREIFSHLTVEENLRVGLGVRKNGPRTIPQPYLRAVSRAEADAEPARRRPFGRAAAATRDRPRAGARAEAADSRRADRRDSAQYRPRNRRHRLEAEQGRRAYRAAGRAEAAVRAPRGERVLHSRQGPPGRCRPDRRTDGPGRARASERLTANGDCTSPDVSWLPTCHPVTLPGNFADTTATP